MDTLGAAHSATSGQRRARDKKRPGPGQNGQRAVTRGGCGWRDDDGGAVIETMPRERHRQAQATASRWGVRAASNSIIRLAHTHQDHHPPIRRQPLAMPAALAIMTRSRPLLIWAARRPDPRTGRVSCASERGQAVAYSSARKLHRGCTLPKLTMPSPTAEDGQEVKGHATRLPASF